MADGSDLSDDVLDFLSEATKGLDSGGEVIQPSGANGSSADRLRAVWAQASREAEIIVSEKQPGHNGYLFTHGAAHVFVYLLAEGEVTAMIPVPYEIVDEVCQSLKKVAYQGLLHRNGLHGSENQNTEGDPE